MQTGFSLIIILNPDIILRTDDRRYSGERIKRLIVDTNELAPTTDHNPASFSEELRRQCNVSAMNTKAKPIALDIGPG